jgi:iron complex transport system substrate-binding protein
VKRVLAYVFFGVMVGFAVAPQSHAEGPKIVSLDSCADQFILALADDDQILALSPNATLQFSHYREKASAFLQHGGTAEEIFGLGPDVALRTGAGDFALTQMLARLGIETRATGLPNNLDDVKADILIFGEALDKNDRAQALVRDIDRRLALLLAAPASDLDGLYMSPGGTTTGPDTFLGEVITLSGLTNLRSAGGWGQIDLEQLVYAPPQVIVGSFFDARTGLADAWRFADHPAMRAIMESAIFIDVPSHLLGCPAWYALDAVDLIRTQLEKAKAEVVHARQD